MGSGKFGFAMKKDKVIVEGAVDSVKDKYHKIQKKLKKTEKQKTDAAAKEKKIWWNQCNSCK